MKNSANKLLSDCCPNAFCTDINCLPTVEIFCLEILWIFKEKQLVGTSLYMLRMEWTETTGMPKRGSLPYQN